MRVNNSETPNVETATPQQKVEEPVAAPQQPEKRYFNLYDDQPADEPTAEAGHTAQPQNYNDGIQLIQHTAVTPVVEEKIQEPIAATLQPIAEVQQPRMETQQPTATMQTVVEKQATETTMLDTLPLRQHTVENHNPAPFVTQQSSVLSTAERLQRAKRLNEMLHNDPNGPQKVASMTTAQLTNESIYTAPHSSESETNRISLNADGTITQRNSFLHGVPD